MTGSFLILAGRWKLLRLLPVMALLSLPALLHAQFDPEQDKEELALLRDAFDSFAHSGDEKTFEAIVYRIAQAAITSRLPLTELSSGIREVRQIMTSRPELKKYSYQVVLAEAVIMNSKGHYPAFAAMIRDAHNTLLAEQRPREACDLNLAAANYLTIPGEHEKARSFYDENERLIEAYRNTAHYPSLLPKAIANANSLGYMYQVNKQPDSAAKYYRIGINRAREQHDDAWEGMLTGNLGSVYKDCGQLDSAGVYLQTDINLSLSKGWHTSALNAMVALAEVNVMKKEFNRARQLLHEADEMNRRSGITDPDFLSRFRIAYCRTMAMAELGLGNLPEAASLFNEAFDAVKAQRHEALEEVRQLLARRYFIEDNSVKVAELEQKSRMNRMIIAGIVILLVIAILVLMLLTRFYSKLREKNREIALKSAHLRETDLQKNKLFSIIAHDLRSPVANLRSLLDLHREGSISENEFMLYSATIRNSLNGLSGTLENLLHWASSAIEGNLHPSPRPTDLRSLLQELRDQLGTMAASKQIRMLFETGTGMPVLAVGTLFSVILRNLLVNAIKFSHQGGTVTVRVDEADEASVTIWVEDQGVGMSPEKTANLFSGFEVARSTYGTAGEQGSGIGLILCREFALAMNGELLVKSTEGKGSAFGLKLKKDSRPGSNLLA